MRIDRVKFVSELARRDLSQTELSSMAGVSRATISNIISGKRCSEEVAQKLALALNCDLSEIIES